MKLKINFAFVVIALTTSCTKYKIIERNPEFADGGGSGTLSPGCSGTLQWCTINPTGEKLTIASTLQFNAVGKFSNSSTLCKISPSWSSSDTAIATINSSSGLATGIGAGTVNIQAVYNTIQCTQSQLIVQHPSCPTITSAQAIDSLTAACGGSPLNWYNMIEIDIQFSNPAAFTGCTIWDQAFVASGGGSTCSVIYYFSNSYQTTPTSLNPSPITIAYNSAAVNYGACIGTSSTQGCFVGYWPESGTTGQPPRVSGGTLCLAAGFGSVNGCQGSIKNLDCLTTSSPQYHCYYNIRCSNVTTGGLSNCTVY